MAKGICSIPDCERELCSRGLCNPHYQRLLKTGDVQVEIPIKRVRRKAEKPCAVSGCDRPSRIRGWCEGHHARWRKTGDVRAEVPLGVRLSRSGACRLDGCDRPIEARRLCVGHLRREDKWGDVMADVPLKRPSDGQCSVPDCGQPHAGLGWCNFHYEPFKRYKLTPDDFAALMSRQGGVCAICGRAPKPGTRLSVDHDHACCSEKKMSCGACIRGLLCDSCNPMIGLARDDIAILRSAIAYLEQRSFVAAQKRPI